MYNISAKNINSRTFRLAAVLLVVLFFSYRFPVFAEEPVFDPVPPVQFFLVPDKAAFLDPDRLIVDVFASTTLPVNVVSLSLAYDPAALFIESDAADAFPLLIEQNTGSAGDYHLSAGTTTRSLVGEHRVARLVFRKLSAGVTTLSLSAPLALAADGLGTSLPTLGETHHIYLYR